MKRPAALFAALLLTGCGSSTTKTVTTTRTATTSVTTAPASTSTASAQPTTASTAALPRCVAASLRLSYLGQEGATGHGELGFALRNSSGHSCHTIGYPGILFLNGAGRPLPTIPAHTTRDFFGHAPLRSLVVRPGASVSFRLGVTHGVTSTADCTTAHGLQVIPPNDTATLRVSIGQGGAYECRTASVSPLRRGHTAFP